MVLISIHRFHCDISRTCQEDERSKDLKTFSQKVEMTLDTFDNVIYVTRITTGATTVFVAVPACNYPFGQGYAH